MAEEAKKVQLADSSFFKDLASEQQRLLDENNKTIQQFSDAAIEKQGEERANFKDLIGNLRENIKNVFDIRSRSGWSNFQHLIDWRGKRGDGILGK
ncbi:MAG: hypothetical protein IH795_11890 [Bacteroidetes bacterium]|nr:hypothetical protein [Bacteroidota bacterium]